MKLVKDAYVIISLILLMILRPFAPGQWFGSVSVSGFLVTWIDTLSIIFKENRKLTLKESKIRYAIVVFVMFLFGAGALILTVINLIIEIDWLNSTIVLDEITLFSLLMCLSQKTLINFLNYIIKGKREDLTYEKV